MLMARWMAEAFAFDGPGLRAAGTRSRRRRRCGSGGYGWDRPRSCLAVFAVVLSLRASAILETSQADPIHFMENEEDLEESYCTYEGYVKTDRTWFGFLANMTVQGTGQLMFDFQFPADKCCPNVLFYRGNQISGISSRINCWQKEGLLHSEQDQILHLTPMFSWSGCRLTRVAGAAMYVCKGGRSLASDKPQDESVVWYTAVSNCAALDGLELAYRLEIQGHVMVCPSSATESTPHGPWGRRSTTPSQKSASVIPRQAELTLLETDQSICIIEGEINSTHNWAGFFQNISFVEGGGFQYEFSFPKQLQMHNVILYSEDEVQELHRKMSCWEKESVVPTTQMDRILELSYRATWNGCLPKNGFHGGNLTCTGGKRFDEARKVFFAVNNCRSTVGLFLYYKLGIFGFDNKELCSERRNAATSLRNRFNFCLFSISLIFGLWKLTRKNYLVD